MPNKVVNAGVAPATPSSPNHNSVSKDAADSVLIEAYSQGDAQAFDILYERYKGPIYRYFLYQLNEAEARDLFQETWFKFVNNLQNYQEQQKLQAYLFAIAHNVLMDHYRKNKKFDAESDEVLDTLEDEQVNLEQAASQSELKMRLLNLVAKLPVAQKSVWLMRYETDLSVADIAELTEAPVEGVKSRLRYATEKLKAGMQKYV